jgi:hypothetical protein
VAVENTIGTLGEIDGSHSASTQFPCEHVATDDAAFQCGKSRDDGPQWSSEDRLFEPSREMAARLKQAMDLSLEIIPSLTLVADEHGLACAVHQQSFFVNAANQTQFFRCQSRFRCLREA